jgi:hypothetical protein
VPVLVHNFLTKAKGGREREKIAAKLLDRRLRPGQAGVEIWVEAWGM